MRDQLSKISDTTLRYARSFGDHGMIAYNTSHQSHKLIRISNDIREIIDLRNKGWKVRYENSYWVLEGPEAVLCDLNELSMNEATQNPVEIFALHNFLTEFMKAQDLDILIQDALDHSDLRNIAIAYADNCTSFIEKRVFGTDIRVQQFPKMFLNYVKKFPEWERFHRESRNQITARPLNVLSRSASASNGRAQAMYRSVLNYYGHLYGSGSCEISKFSDQVVFGFWKQLPKRFESLVFILKASLKYYLGYLEEMGDIDARLIEYHIDPGSKQLLVENTTVRDRNTLIVDRSYSGNTLDKMKELLSREGAKPSVLAIFPKSVSAVAKSDFFLFLDKIIEKARLDMSKEGWETDLFRDIVNNEIEI
jgi:hypothetical protein